MFGDKSQVLHNKLRTYVNSSAYKNPYFIRYICKRTKTMLVFQVRRNNDKLVSIPKFSPSPCSGFRNKLNMYVFSTHYTLLTTHQLQIGPIVYRLGHKILILESGVRFSVGSHQQKCTGNSCVFLLTVIKRSKQTALFAGESNTGSRICFEQREADLWPILHRVTNRS